MEEQPREGLFLAGATNCWEEFSRFSLSLSLSMYFYPCSLDALPCGWLVLFIGEGPGPLPKY